MLMQHLIIYLHIKEEYIVAEITNKQKLATVGYVEAILHKLQDWMPFKRKNSAILRAQPTVARPLHIRPAGHHCQRVSRGNLARRLRVQSL